MYIKYFSQVEAIKQKEREIKIVRTNEVAREKKEDTDSKMET